MCGRCRCTLNPEDVPGACGINASSIPVIQSERYHPSYNVSPGTYLPVVRKEHGANSEPVVHCMKWGLIPSFTKKTEKPDHFRMFNARSESACEKASFRRLIPNNRCLIAVEGFFEWKKGGHKKQPYYIHFKDHRPLVFAALYDSWTNAEGEVIHTFTILTTRCSSALEWLHDRMPVIFGDDSSKDAWLSSLPSTKAVSMLQPYEGSDLAWYPVTPMVGKPSFNGPECVKEIQLKQEQKAAISSFFSKRELERKTTPESQKQSSTPESQKQPFSQSPHCDGFVKENGSTEECESFCSPDLDASEAFETAEAAKICGAKRDFEQFAASDGKALESVADDNSLGMDDIKNDKSQPPVKRKSDGKGGVHNQQTLLSYFGRC